MVPPPPPQDPRRREEGARRPQAQEASRRGLASACVPGHEVYAHHARLHSPGPQEGTGDLAVPVPNPREEGVARHGLRASRALGGAQNGGQAHVEGDRGSPERCSSPLLHPNPTSMPSSCGGRGVERGADQGGVKPGAAGRPQEPRQHSPGQPPCPWQSAARTRGLEAHDPGEGSAPAHRAGHSPMAMASPWLIKGALTRRSPPF